MARWIGASRPGIKVIEVDAIKVRKYGTTDCCNESEDFPEAGRMAHDELRAGHDVVIVEAFCDEQHLNWVLAPMHLALASPQVSAVWLDCAIATSLARKFPALGRDVIGFQHQRRASRFRPPAEIVVGTDDLAAERVAQRVLALTAFGADQRSSRRPPLIAPR